MNRDKSDVLILFNGAHLAYSPTVIQLYDELSKKYNVTIIAQSADNYNGQELTGRHVLYYRIFNRKSRYFYLMLFKFLVLFDREAKALKSHGFNYKDYFFRFLFIKRALKHHAFRRVISVDNINLFFCSQLNTKTDFLSLELCDQEHLLPLVNERLIGSVIIQSADRYNYLFKDQRFKTFYVQNAPVFRELKPVEKKNGLIYAGGAYAFFGFYHCLNYIRQYADEKLTVQGALLGDDKKKVYSEYADLLEAGRLVVNSGYLDNDDIVPYIATFETGFCFYDFDDPFIQRNYFNYASAPSGKLFKYLAAGVPVICNNIPRFQFVKGFQCGVLIDDLGEATIRQAVLLIRNTYPVYAENAVRAARHYSFDKAVLPYIDYLHGEINKTVNDQTR